MTRSGFGWARFEFRPARFRLDCFLGRLIGGLAGWLDVCLHDLLVGRSGSIARGTFPSEVRRRFAVGGVLEACGSEFKARNSKLEGWNRKDLVVSNHSIVGRSTCEGDGFVFRVSGLVFKVYGLGLKPYVFSSGFGAQRLLGTENLIH